MLEPMSGLDAGFLYMETPTLHMHTLKVAIVKPPSGEEVVSFDEFRQVLARKLATLPAFHQRVVRIPYGLDHHAWTPDPDFDIARHLAHRRLEAPGDQRQLDAVVSEIAGRSLPRDRPLWELTMVEGLAEGRVAFVCKIHHSMADGNAALEMLLHVVQREADRPAPARSSEPARLPTKAERVRFGVARALGRIRALPRLVYETLRGLRALRRVSRAQSAVDVPSPFATPATEFNVALTSDRIFVSRSLSLESLKRAKRALGVTLNDVVLGLCGEILRAHLEARGALPEQALVAGVPVNTRPGEKGRLRGNRVGHLMCSLRTDIADPVQRIRAISEIMRAVKQRHAALGSDLMENWFDYTPPGPFTAIVRWWSKRRISDWVRPPINLVVSTVPGAREPLHVGRAELEALYSVGPILEGIGLNITAWSYHDEMCFVGLACPQHVPDLAELIGRLPGALEDLLRRCAADGDPVDDERSAGSDDVARPGGAASLAQSTASAV